MPTSTPTCPHSDSDTEAIADPQSDLGARGDAETAVAHDYPG